MKPREIFLRALSRESVPRPATGSATSIVTVDLMKKVGIYFPDVHLDSEKMADLAVAGYTEIGFDNVMPLFSIWHESAAMGCKVDWGKIDRMPACREILYEIEDEIHVIPCDDEGYIMPPHTLTWFCFCNPECNIIGDDGRPIIVHEMEN